MLDGIDGASTWCGWGVLAHNATKISVLIEEREDNGPIPSEATIENRGRTTRPTPANAAQEPPA